MRFTRDMIQQPKLHFCFNKYTDYWRHYIKEYSESESVSFDFVKNGNKRGYRVNIRVLPKGKATWQRNGRPVFYKQHETTATCWIRPDGVPEDIQENKNNKQQKQSGEMADWRPFMQALYEKLGGSPPLVPNTTEVIE